MFGMELKLKHVTKKYGDKVALDDFSFTFREGICGILGANGAGKSTMMNLITDNLKRDEGKILFGGRDIRYLGRDFRRVLGYMPQQQGMYEGMTAESFLVYIAELKEIPRREIRAEVDRVLDMTGMSEVRHHRIRSFSGGMKQRVLLATHIVSDIEAIADSVLLLKDGKLLRSGTPEELIASLPDGWEPVLHSLSLEDVYLYYLGDDHHE